MLRRLQRMLLRSGIVRAHRVNLGKGDVRVRTGIVQPYGFQKQRQGFVLPLLDTVKLREVIPWPRIRGFPVDPLLLFLNVGRGFAIQREVNHFFAPETQRLPPTRISRTSITLVFVGPVTIRSPRLSK